MCVLADTLTKSERRLVQAGEQAIVLEHRSTMQKIMRADAVAAVESLSGRTVTAFMSNNHIDPDVAVETFVLKPLQSRDTQPDADRRPAEESPGLDGQAEAPAPSPKNCTVGNHCAGKRVWPCLPP